MEYGIMKGKTEELLYLLLWGAEKLTRPSFRNLTDSYESWAYRNGLLREASRLQQQGYLEKHLLLPNDRVYRLTALGRIHALGGRDPVSQWSRDWDGLWRLVLFDIPIKQNSHRNRLR